MTATVHTLPAITAGYDAGAVAAVHAFSTGRAFQHKEHRNGSVLPQLWWVLTSQSWVGLPISVFLIEHKDGLVLFDTGLDPAIVSDPEYISQAIGRFLLKRIFRFEINPDDKLGYKLRRCCQSNANQSSASFGEGVLIQPKVAAIRRGRRFSSI